MDEPSFDPRSWSKLQAGKQNADHAPDDSGAAVGPGQAQEGGLPEAWRTVADEAQRDAALKTGLKLAPAGKPPGDAPGSIAEAPAPRRGSRLAIAAAVAALCAAAGGGAWYWLARSPVAAPSGPAGGASETAQPTPEAATPAPTPEAPPPMAIERSLNLTGAGELAEALAAVDVPPAQAAAAAKAALAALKAPGQVRARIVLTPDGQALSLQKLQASYFDGSGVVVLRDDAGAYKASAVAADLSRQVKVLNGELDSESFYTSAVAAGLIDTLIPEFINAFGYDFNLASEVQPGDTFEVAYEQSVNDNGDAVGTPQLLFAQLTTRTKSLALYRFRNAEGQVGWYDGNGASTQRGLMRTPVDGARISSKFGMRFHPVLHYNKLHGGTDFAAPTGTPIYAAADGVVQFAAMKGANGNLTVIRHDNGWLTLYLHQSRFMPGIAAGARVMQGQHIGDIGTTGRSTGPHLHYEVHIDGQRVDPLSIPTDTAKRKRMDGTLLAAFIRERDRVDVARARQGF